jgi:hypothetical protein
MVASQGSNFVWIFATYCQLPIGNQFVAVKFNPRLYQAELFAGQFARENLAIPNADGCLKFSVLGVDVRQIVLFVVDEIQSNDNSFLNVYFLSKFNKLQKVISQETQLSGKPATP